MLELISDFVYVISELSDDVPLFRAFSALITFILCLLGVSTLIVWLLSIEVLISIKLFSFLYCYNNSIELLSIWSSILF